MVQSAKESSASELEIWYKANVPLGLARGNFPGRVAWGHNPQVASWDGKTGYWWDDQSNNQEETDKLFAQTIFSLTEKKTEEKAWEALFTYYNQSKKDEIAGKCIKK